MSFGGNLTIYVLSLLYESSLDKAASEEPARRDCRRTHLSCSPCNLVAHLSHISVLILRCC